MAAVGEPAETGDTDQRGHRRMLRFLLRSAASLATSTVITAGIGFIFWAVAARAFPAIAVGESSTAVSAMGLLAPMSVLGFGTLVMVQLPAMRHGRSALVSTATAVCGAAASILALACAVLLPDSFLGLPGAGHQLTPTLLFVGLVATQAICLVLDQAFLSVTGAGIQLRRNLVQSFAKLAMIIAVAAVWPEHGAEGIVASWLLANILSIVAVIVMLGVRYRVRLLAALPRLSALRGLHFAAARHHSLNTALFVPYFAMPIVANVILGSEQAAYLYATWSLAGFVFFLPVALATALFASGARDTSTFLMEFKFTLRFALLVCLAANVVIAVFGGLILRIFGKAYQQNGHLVLVVLALGSLGTVIKDHHVTLARVIGYEGREAVLMTVLGVGEIAGAAAGAYLGGLLGLSLGWVVAVAVEVVVCLPLVLRAVRGQIVVSPRRPAMDQADGGAS